MLVKPNPFDDFRYPNCHDAYNYAVDVLTEKIPACVYVKGACKRFIQDLEPNELFYFDPKRAERYLKLVQKFHHVKGKWDPPNIVYMSWQKFVWANIMGFVDRRTNERRFRTAHVEVPRGNGKSPMAGQAVLFFLGLDNPVGNEISCIASKTDQAKIVLNNARNMAKKNFEYLAATNVEVREHSIIHPPSNSIARALSSDDKSLDGLTDVLAVMDELHAVPRELFDVVTSGMKKRNDSLTLCITTAGFNKDTSGYSQSQYAKKVCLGDVIDESFFAVVWTIDEADDIYSEISWRKANPCYGVSVDPITFAASFEKAKHSPADLPGLMVKNLNIWLNQAKSYFNMQKLKACADPKLKLEDFKGKKCFSGLDLATVDDLCTRAYVFRENGIYYAFTKTYVAEEARKRHNRDIYPIAIDEGNLIEVPGEVIDLENFQEDYLRELKEYRVQKVLYDPHQATSMAQFLMKNRIEVLEFRQTLANFAEPTKKLYALILEGKFRYNGSSLTEWCFSNVVVKPDSTGAVRPLKEDEAKKIDEVIAIVQALAPWLEIKEDSPYSTRGIRYLD